MGRLPRGRFAHAGAPITGGRFARARNGSAGKVGEEVGSGETRIILDKVDPDDGGREVVREGTALPSAEPYPPHVHSQWPIYSRSFSSHLIFSFLPIL